MSKGILTADIHLSPLPRDEYRWGLFPWLVKQAEKHKPDYIAILGDLTQFKDEHQGSFVNRVVDAIATLTEHVGEVVFIPGNHDGIEASKPFFRFLERMTKITVAWKPQPVTGFVNVFALPHTRNYEQDWESVLSKRGNCIYDYPVVLCHQTFDGSISENGTKLEGIPPSVFKRFKGRVYSGDIHVPQKVGKNGPEYVGAPYRVRFGDTFEPRCLLIG
jgi:DNA repair exonuclease SbcCD nuclease subunit